MREDVRTLLHSTARPPTMEIDPEDLWRRGRRRRHRVNAAVTAVTVLALAVAAIAVTRTVATPVSYVRVNESVPGADVGDGRRVRGVGAVIVGPDGRAEFCHGLYWAGTASDPGSPSCAHGPGVALTGLTMGQVPDQQTDHGVAWGRAAVTGTLTADGVEVDSVDPAPPDDAPADERFFTGEDLERIWAVQLAPEVDDVVGYTQDHVDEFGGAWWEDDTVLVLAFTGHVDDHRAAIAQRWPHTFRVIQARYTQQELARTQVAINADEDLRGRLPGRVLFAYDVDVPGQVVEVAVTVDDRVTREAIGQRYDLAMLDLQPRFEIVDGAD